jgi:hypothetical protein
MEPSLWFQTVNDDDFLREGLLLLGQVKTYCNTLEATKVYRRFFGLTPEQTKWLWRMVEIPPKGTIIHLLWALHFLRAYDTVDALCHRLNVTAKTWRKWVWAMVAAIAQTDMVSWEDRFQGMVPGATALVTVDGTDCMIREPEPFDKKWFSHKFNGPGLRYEIAVAIYTGWIVWVHGPFPAGEWTDARIVRDALVGYLCSDEQFVADSGYRGCDGALTPTGLSTPRDKQMAAFRARHETVNRRLKEFRCISAKSRHPPEKHGLMFLAVANLVNLKLKYSIGTSWGPKIDVVI